MPNESDDSNNKKVVSAIPRNSLEEIGKKQQKQTQVQDEQDFSHKGENRHSKNTKEEVDIKHLKPNLKAKIKEEFKKHKEEQQILLKENKQKIIDFIIDNKNSIRIDDLKIYEPIYKCHREKGNCHICNSLSNIVCKNCNYKDVWLCTNHWQEYIIEKHE